MDLAQKKCVPCEGGAAPISEAELNGYMSQLPGSWSAAEGGKKIRKEFQFRDFKEAIGFVDKLARLAEEEGHHPDIYIFYNRVVVELWTHAIGGLSENDFILAAKAEKLLS